MTPSRAHQPADRKSATAVPIFCRPTGWSGGNPYPTAFFQQRYRCLSSLFFTYKLLTRALPALRPPAAFVPRETPTTLHHLLKCE